MRNDGEKHVATDDDERIINKGFTKTEPKTAPPLASVRDCRYLEKRLRNTELVGTVHSTSMWWQ
jgi:hypothetical protein